MTTAAGQNTPDATFPPYSGPTHEISISRELNARFDADAVKLDGPLHNGAWHRALEVARRLVAAGVWNGVDPIRFDAYDLHNRLFGVARMSPHELVPGVDYRIRATQPSSGRR